MTRRFGVVQGTDDHGDPKVRPIDDFTASLVNKAITTNEKAQVHTLDVMSAALSTWMKLSSQTQGGCCSLVGKTYDLNSAYRQLPLSPEMERFSHIAAWCPESGRAEAFRLKCLPFGATASVYHFLRCSAALWYIACVGGCLLVTSYFDDFLLASPDELKTSSANFLEFILLATGWTFARDGDKATDMSCTIQALGALICLEGVPRGIVEIKNTESRISELVNSIGQCLEASRLDRGTAEKLRGRLGFAENHVFGRAGVLA